MKVLGHTAFSLAAGSIVYSISPSFYGFIYMLVAGILVDIDHYFDYIRERGITFNIKKVHDIMKDANSTFGKLVLFFHSYELLIIIWSVIFLFDLNLLWKYAAIGLTLHLVLDQATNPVLPLTYFLSFRIANNFEAKKIFQKKEVACGDTNRT